MRPFPFQPTAYIDGRAFYGTFADRDSAELQAKVYGLTVRNEGVLLIRIDPQTKVAIEWESKPGHSSTWDS